MVWSWYIFSTVKFAHIFFFSLFPFLPGVARMSIDCEQCLFFFRFTGQAVALSLSWWGECTRTRASSGEAWSFACFARFAWRCQETERLLLPRPHFSARPNRFGSRGSRSEITERDWENINALHAWVNNPGSSRDSTNVTVLLIEETFGFADNLPLLFLIVWLVWLKAANKRTST